MRDRVPARRGPSAGARAGVAGDSAATVRAAVATVAAVALACVALAGVLGATVGAGLTGCRGCGAQRHGGAGDALAPVGEREALDWAQTALLYHGAPAALRCERGIDDREWICAGMVGFTRTGPGRTVREVGWCSAAVIVRGSGPPASGTHLSELDRSACPRDVTAALRASDG